MIDWFDPAYKAGGPIRSIVNLVGRLKDHFDIFVFAGAYDLSETQPMSGIELDQWTHHETGAKVFYATHNFQSWNSIKRIINSVDPYFIHCNGMFSKAFTIYPLLMKKMGAIHCGIIVSVRGMLKPSALSYKAGKKKLFLRLVRLLGIHRFVRFHATDKTEAMDIASVFGNVEHYIAANFPAPASVPYTPVSKSKGELNILFIGRIHPIKKLDFLLDAINKAGTGIKLTIAGLLEDKEYWKYCEQIAANNISGAIVEFVGDMPHNKLSVLIANTHIFALPTSGENFGHAIFESLSYGRPALISDQTPWRKLSISKAGWDIPLNDQDAYVRAIKQAVDWNQDTYNEWSAGAKNFVTEYLEGSELESEYKKIYN